MQTTKNRENCAQHFGEDYLTNNLVKFLQESFKSLSLYKKSFRQRRSSLKCMLKSLKYTW